MAINIRAGSMGSNIKHVVFLFLLWVLSSYAQAACSVNGAGEILTNTTGFVDCYSDTGEQKLNIQYLALCTTLPTVSNYQQQCDVLFDEPAGKDIIFSQGSVVNLMEGRTLSLPEAVFTHSVVRIGSVISIKGQYLFDKPLLGGAGGVGKNCWTATTGTAGTYSDYQDYVGYSSLNQLATQCGNTASPEFITQDYNIFWGAGGLSNSITGSSSPTGSYDMYTMSSPNTLSSEVPGSPDGRHLLGIQAFDDPVVITAAIKSVDIGFKMEGMFHLQSNWQREYAGVSNLSRQSDGGGSKLPTECVQNQNDGNSCFAFVIPTGFEFSVTAE